MDSHQNDKQQYNATVELKSWSERSYFDQLVDLFIRPPRQIYDTKALGSSTFYFQKLMIHREDFIVPNQRGQKIHCSLFSAVRHKDKDRPCVIYLHGNSSSRLEAQPYAGIVTEGGMSLLTFDFAGCGMSDGQFVSLGWFEKLDLFEVVQHLKKAFPRLIKFGLWGRSMGAVTAIMAATECQDFSVIVADSPFLSLKQLCIDIGDKQYSLPRFVVRMAFYMLRKRIRRVVNYDPKNLKTDNHIKKLGKNCSIFFLRASEDRMIYQNHVDDLYTLFKGEKYLTIFQGNHNSNRPTEIYQNIIKFFVNRLKPQKCGNDELFVPPQQYEASDKTNEPKQTENGGMEIALEYNSEEKINNTKRKVLLNEKSSNSSCKFDEEYLILNSPLHCDYTIGKEKLGTPQNLGQIFETIKSIDSERCIHIAHEQTHQQKIPQFQEGNKR